MVHAAQRLPVRRADLVIRPIGERGRFVIKDPRTGSYFQIGEQEQFLLERLDGVQSSASIRRDFETQFGEPLSSEDLAEFLTMAESQGFLAPAAPVNRVSAYENTPLNHGHSATDTPLNQISFALLGRDPEHSRSMSEPLEALGRPDIISVGSAGVTQPTAAPVYPAAAPATASVPGVPAVAPTQVPEVAVASSGPDQSILYWRKSLFDPDKLFDQIVPWLGFLWTRAFVVVSLLGVLAAFCLMIANWGDMVSGFTGSLRWETGVLVWVTLLIATTLHEFAHGLTLKRFGGEVHQIGVLIMFFLPCLFCNVSDAWLIRERWKRMLVTLAGGYCDLCLWALAVFAWRITPLDTLANYICWVVLTVLGARVFFNFNPFLKLDGYYLLGDFFEVPNLLQRGQERAKMHLRRVLWGAPPPPSDPQGRVLTLYGFASWLYGLTFLFLMLLGMFKYFWTWLGPAGLAMAVGLAAVLFKTQFKGVLATDFKEMLAQRGTRTTIWVLIALALTGLAMIPIPDRAGGSFRVRSSGKIEVRAPASGVLQTVHYEEGDTLTANAVIAQMEIPDLASRMAQKKAEASEARAKLQLLEAGPNPAQVAELTERVERATRWHMLAQKDLDRDRLAHLEDISRLNALISRCEAESQLAASNLARQKILRSQEAVSVEEYDAVAARARVASEQLVQAHAELRAVKTRGTATAETELARRAKDLADATGALTLLKAGPRKEEIAAARASLERIEEECRYLKQLGDKLTIRALRSGMVTTSRFKERVGRFFHEGDLICELEDTRDLEVEIYLREGQTARVCKEQEVELLARAFPFKTFQARVRQVAPAARRPSERNDVAPATAQQVSAASSSTPDAEGQVAIYCRLEDPENCLQPGMTGHARIYRGSRAVGVILFESILRTIRIEFWR